MKEIIKKIIYSIILMITFISLPVNAFAKSDSKKAEFIHNHSEILGSLNGCNKYWKKNGDVRIDYLEQMIHHNEIEICMCENIIRYTNNNDVLNIANKFIKSSKECNLQLNELLDEMRKNPIEDKLSEEKYAEEYDKKYCSMLLQLQLKRDDINIDRIFFSSSKKHHECMKRMCEIIAKYSNDEKINNLSNNISNRIEKEIKKIDKMYKHIH
ncbi:MAG: DUF305 domain-containing protein [Clostridium butyricum]|nr:DUF305 domain-containing protein [Clostridium butyricum]